MVDVFGSKNLLDIITSIYGEDKINNTILSSSLESQYTSSIAPNSNNLELVSDADKEIIVSDFRKSFRKNDDKTNILFVDLLSERNAIANYNDSRITLNSEIRKFIKDENLKTLTLEKRIKLLPNLVNNFVSTVEDYEKVVVCEFYLTNHYLDENNMIKLNPDQYGINKVNALLKTFYDLIKYQNNNFVIIQFESVYSDINHSKKPSPWIYSSFSKKQIESAIKVKV